LQGLKITGQPNLMYTTIPNSLYHFIVQTIRTCSCSDGKIIILLLPGYTVLYTYVGSCEAGENYVNQLKDVLAHSCPKRIAGFFAESIQVTKKLSNFYWITQKFVGCRRSSSVS